MKKLSVLFAAPALFLCMSPVHAETTTRTIAQNSPAISEATANPEVRFWRAVGEAVVIGYSPWLYSHYIKDFEYANISMDTVRTNFEEGFVFDQDSFQTNQFGHPFQGSLYYNAGRENGFNFYEASLLTLAGDFGWEFFMESERPSYNDMINTWFGGTSRGEVTHRLSKALRDNRATGSEKFWRELGAGIMNPVGFLDRAVFGDMWEKKDNPPDRLPSKLFITMDSGYKRGRDSSSHPDQGYIALDVRQNDPHEQLIEKPFDYFDLQGALSLAKGPLIPAVTYRGLLAGWDLVDEGDVHHMLAPALSYDYFNNTDSAFGGQGLELAMLSRWKLRNDFELRTDVGAQGYIYAGIQVDYDTDNAVDTGRNYDFGSGGGPRVDVRIRRQDVDWFRCTIASGWFVTNNGISSQSRIFQLNTEVRYPLTKDLFAGVGWSLQDRYTLYDHHPASSRTNSGIKAFLSWAFRMV